MKRRRAILVGGGFVAFILFVSLSPVIFQQFLDDTFRPLVSQLLPANARTDTSPAQVTLDLLAVKGRAPKTGYARSEFGNGWGKIQGCSVREVILHRDLKNIVMKNECQVASGVLDDPYTGKTVNFTRDRSSDVQIDHVVALSDAWQKGAQNIPAQARVELANDPLNLLAVDGPANQQKSDADAATWLPKNKSFRCEYIERQVAVKYKYSLWVTTAEKAAMQQVLTGCV